ncbi:MAG: hypothetical protein L6M37_03965 [Candidatus Methylarchaceae archaeon HK02M1]|nr:hypothetical protein [Candidatus Methylarchaceae archaeon HK01M]MCP8312095.1 hypothetical protein [Candidatus Methylarchaceae archaeon HK02M1]
MKDQPKYSIKVLKREKPLRVSKEVKEVLKGAVSGKMMKNMKYESVLCPVIKEEVPFLECFACESFMRRFKGEVHCAGLKGSK